MGTIQKGIDVLRNESVAETGTRLRRRTLRQLNRVRPDGTPIYEREWDVLVVLDACRLDLMEGVADEYEFIERVDSE